MVAGGDYRGEHAERVLRVVRGHRQRGGARSAPQEDVHDGRRSSPPPAHVQASTQQPQRCCQYNFFCTEMLTSQENYHRSHDGVIHNVNVLRV